MEARVSPAPGGPVSAPPTATSSVVNLRNDASTPVEVEITLDGKSIRTALIAPDSLVPLRLPPGAYQVRAAGRGATSGQSTLAVAANRTHGLLIQRRQNDGKDVLVFIEPLEPSADD